MPQARNSRTVAFPAERLFRAVMDIESYPRILTFVRAIKILSRDADSITARVLVGLPILTFSYDCRIVFHEFDTIDVYLLSGPFKKLESHWRFTVLDAESCRIDYDLDCAFKNSLMEHVAGAIFTSQLAHAVAAFEASLKRP